MIDAVIIDDEPNNVHGLQALLQKYCPEVNIIGVAEGPLSGYDLIKKLNPQLAFLDIEMRYGNAFDLLNRLEKVDFEIIFVTAFDRYAIKAFKYAAVDYLLKPIDIGELKQAVEKAIRNIELKTPNQKVNNLIKNADEELHMQKIAIAGVNGLTFINTGRISRLEAQKNYTIVHVNGTNKITAAKNLGSFEDLLPESIFCRIHHSHIVNLNFIRKYTKGRGGYVEMEDGTVIEVSVRKKETFLERFKNQNNRSS